MFIGIWWTLLILMAENFNKFKILEVQMTVGEAFDKTEHFWSWLPRRSFN